MGVPDICGYTLQTSYASPTVRLRLEDPTCCPRWCCFWHSNGYPMESSGVLSGTSNCYAKRKANCLVLSPSQWEYGTGTPGGWGWANCSNFVVCRCLQPKHTRTSSKSIQLEGHNPPHSNKIEETWKISYDSLIFRED